MKKDNSLWKQEFAKRLRESLEESHMSATELSNATQVGKSDISNYLQAKYLPKQDRVFLMAQALGVDPVWLYALDVKYALEAQYNTATPEETLAYVRSMTQPNYHTAFTEPVVIGESKDNAVLEMLSGMSRLSEEDQRKLLDMARVMFPNAFPK